MIFSSLTVAAAMLSLLVFPQRFLYSMAISGSLTALAAGFIALTALPALLMVLGPRVDAFAPQRWRHREIDPQRGFWYRLSHFVMRRPIPIALTTAAVLIAAGLPFTRIEFTGVDASALPDSAAAKQVDTALRTEFPAGRGSPLHVVVSAGPDQSAELYAYARQLASDDHVAAVDATLVRQRRPVVRRGRAHRAGPGHEHPRARRVDPRRSRAGAGARGRRVGALRRPAHRASATACRWRSPCWRSRRC